MLKRNDALHLRSLFCRLSPEAVGMSEIRGVGFYLIISRI